MEYRRCVRCVMDNKSDTTIRFDKEGFCNYCSDTIKRKQREFFPGEEGANKFNDLIKKIKDDCKNDKYDCLIGVSGGIDSSYILYKGYQYGLRMLAVHIDDGLDNPIALSNIQKLIKKTGADLISIVPDRSEYSDILCSLFKASVSNLAIAQDNLIGKALQDYADANGIKYMFDGANFAAESILERGEDCIDPSDKKFILGIQKKFGRVKIENTQFMSLKQRYICRHRKKVKHIRPLNYMNYNVSDAIKELEEFSQFEYYGGKHYESILTRFMQCYYLPTKFGIDKRKSHYSSLIMSGQMSRDEAIKLLEMPLYRNAKTLDEDKAFLAQYMQISLDEFEEYLSRPAKKMTDYPHSFLNKLAPIARVFRRFLD